MKKLWSGLSRRQAPSSIEEHFLAGNFSTATRLYDRLEKNQATPRESVVAFAASVIDGGERRDFLSDIQVLSTDELIAQSRAEPLSGPLVQKDPGVKHLLLAQYAHDYRRRTLIETGTYIGLTSALLSGLFDWIVTIEADPALHNSARRLFEVLGMSNVTALCGDSAQLLVDLDIGNGEDALVFLDAHYSHGLTSRVFGVCPVIKEVSYATSHWPAALIVVDDVRTMIGRRGYPSLLDIIKVIDGSRSLVLMQDQLIILPSELAR